MRCALRCAAVVVLLATAARAQVKFDTVSRPVLEKRLGEFAGNNRKRGETVKSMFLEAGCKAENLSEQVVPSRTEPNVICVLPGTTETTVVVGAHLDYVDRGNGVVDNWSGASMLPSLLQGLRGVPRAKTFVFVAFAGEEEGLLGSQLYVDKLTREQRGHIEEMVNLDTLGLGPALVWSKQSDPVLLGVLAQVAKATKLPVSGLNLDGAGVSDEESFIAAGVCALSVHSVTASTWHVLHSTDDTVKQIKGDDYYATYRLMQAYLAALDSVAIEKHACKAVAQGVGRAGSDRHGQVSHTATPYERTKQR